MGKQNFTSVGWLINALKQTKQDDVSGSSKESPVLSSEHIEIQEKVEHRVEDELKDHIQTRLETIKIPTDLIKFLGPQPTTQTNFSTYQNIKLPIPDEKILIGLHAPITSSLRWLAAFAQYVLAHAHLTLKKVHGKIMRVIKT